VKERNRDRERESKKRENETNVYHGSHEYIKRKKSQKERYENIPNAHIP
jgi:hypothetical protein